jgi:hypothetical protein
LDPSTLEDNSTMILQNVREHIPKDLNAEKHHCRNLKTHLMEFVCFCAAATTKTIITNVVAVIAVNT